MRKSSNISWITFSYSNSAYGYKKIKTLFFKCTFSSILIRQKPSRRWGFLLYNRTNYPKSFKPISSSMKGYISSLWILLYNDLFKTICYSHFKKDGMQFSKTPSLSTVASNCLFNQQIINHYS